ncbi:prepilin-type N-terminal cleavage/methylation domain-containing protein [Sporosarcina cascadiensis]|uniref:prepilin-type N-terminal cleavage/methylation domain-containing protein n=1 Tax=Sporosarcina cascadiensis TaxID=2660747 RepID=UPI00129AC12E|nr:prepilin-type N-terminal cleavage/methylation domain-containing protein [Sporosarcina cascadiensis]
MKNFLQKKLKNEKGLTLVELLAVIVILGIIAAIAIPAIGNIIDNSRVKAAKADAQNIISAGNMYFTENPDEVDVEVEISKLKSEGFLESEGSLTNTGKVKKVKDTGVHFTGTTNEKIKPKVTFTNATSKDITDSGKKTEVTNATP